MEKENKLNEAVRIAKLEIKNPEWGVTQQFLEIHQIEEDNGDLKVAHIDRQDLATIVYFKVKGQNFYFIIEVEDNGEISSVDIENGVSLYLFAISESLTAEEMESMTKLPATEKIVKGNQRPGIKIFYKFNAITIEPNLEPAPFEIKLKKLLAYLCQDREGILRLTHQVDCFIRAHIVFHNANTILRGFHLDKKIIQQMSDLNLDIDFALFAEGELFL